MSQCIFLSYILYFFPLSHNESATRLLKEPEMSYCFFFALSRFPNSFTIYDFHSHLLLECSDHFYTTESHDVRDIFE